MRKWQPLSVRYGNRWAKLKWRVLDAREAVALWLAPWLRPGSTARILHLARRLGMEIKSEKRNTVLPVQRSDHLHHYRPLPGPPEPPEPPDHRPVSDRHREAEKREAKRRRDVREAMFDDDYDPRG